MWLKRNPPINTDNVKRLYKHLLCKKTAINTDNVKKTTINTDNVKSLQ